MKLKKADLLMVIIIILILGLGLSVAFGLRKEKKDSLPTGETAVLTETEGENTCFVEISCSTILEQMERLPSQKAAYVPANGRLLAKTEVNFTEGETAFDILQRVCEEVGIPLEYSFTPLYNSYYIEGINHLYEFDCGPRSGWMYEVNGTFPNYGASSYPVNEKDEIVWHYTCEGLGLDVGAKEFSEYASQKK